MFSCSRHHYNSLEFANLRVINHDLIHLITELQTYISISRKEMGVGERLSLAAQIKDTAGNFVQETDPKAFKEGFGIAFSEAPHKLFGHFRPTQFYLGMGQMMTRILGNMGEAVSMERIRPGTTPYALYVKLHEAIYNLTKAHGDMRVEFPVPMQPHSFSGAPSVAPFTPTFTPPAHHTTFQAAQPPSYLSAPPQSYPPAPSMPSAHLPSQAMPSSHLRAQAPLPSLPPPLQFLQTQAAPSSTFVPAQAHMTSLATMAAPAPRGPRVIGSGTRRPDPEFERLLSSYMEPRKGI